MKNEDYYVDLLRELIFEDMLQSIPTDFDTLSTHTVIEDVYNIVITDIEEDLSTIIISGEAEVEAELGFGSHSDIRNGDGLIDRQSFLTSFVIVLDEDEQILKSKYDIKEDFSAE